MEAFESVVAVSLESEGYVVSPAIKFPVTLRTKRAAYEEIQHGYEVDLVAARANRLVLATVKSFFGSRGVIADHVTGETKAVSSRRLYALLNNTRGQQRKAEGDHRPSARGVREGAELGGQPCA